MIYTDKQMEEQALLQVAALMSAAARTAPKARGRDYIVTLVLTGDEKDALAAKMEEIAQREFGDGKTGHFPRDAGNLRASQAVVMVGVKKSFGGLPYCSLCGFENCAKCKEAGARCAYNTIDLGIALGSACAAAADHRVDSRIMFSPGKAAEEMNYTDDNSVIWHAIPISVTGKSIFFDRK